MAYKKAAAGEAAPRLDFEISREVQPAFEASSGSADTGALVTSDDAHVVREGSDAIVSAKQTSRRLVSRLAGR